MKNFYNGLEDVLGVLPSNNKSIKVAPTYATGALAGLILFIRERFPDANLNKLVAVADEMTNDLKIEDD